MSSAETSTSAPLRRTIGFASPISDSFSRVLLARYSWMIPIAELKMITKPNSESWNGARAAIMSAHNVPITMLKEVTVFSRTMLPRLRLLGLGALLVCPAATR